MLGIGKVEKLNGDDEDDGDDDTDSEIQTDGRSEIEEATTTGTEADSVSVATTNTATTSAAAVTADGPKSWAALVKPSAAVTTTATPNVLSSLNPPTQSAGQPISLALQKMSIREEEKDGNGSDGNGGGQFSDAEDDDDFDFGTETQFANSTAPTGTTNAQPSTSTVTVEEDLSSDFPSLAASLQVPYEGSDNEDDEQEEEPAETAAQLAKAAAEERKKEALKPVTKSGKLYNSFKKYKKVMKPKKNKQKQNDDDNDDGVDNDVLPDDNEDEAAASTEQPSSAEGPSGSHILGGMGAGFDEGGEVEDDGEGWITCSRDIQKMKAHGQLDPTHGPNKHPNDGKFGKPKEVGPPMEARCACATTDFAMQNVLLQMNMELLSVDGVKVRRLKTWVSRCGACFTVFPHNEQTGPFEGKRLFCSRCGSDMIQRIAASVDGKTGRLRLHFSKKYRNNIRGTKFSLPKAGTGDRFQGELLLREDQLLSGAWNQKVKKLSGGKSRAAASSQFGSDLATNVGCHARMVNLDDIRVGFGRRNPNAAKGRERRGKKKKSSDKACGLRRY